MIAVATDNPAEARRAGLPSLCFSKLILRKLPILGIELGTFLKINATGSAPEVLGRSW
jgi:hypothetical protein